MAKQKFERTKPHMNVGTMGHIDHGKTAVGWDEMTRGEGVAALWARARIGELGRRQTLMFNGYEEQVAHLYEGMNLAENY